MYNARETTRLKGKSTSELALDVAVQAIYCTVISFVLIKAILWEKCAAAAKATERLRLSVGIPLVLLHDIFKGKQHKATHTYIY